MLCETYCDSLLRLPYIHLLIDVIGNFVNIRHVIPPAFLIYRSRMPVPPRQHVEQVTVVETVSSPWKGDVLADRRYLHISRGDESREVRLPCQAVCVSGVCSRTYNFLCTARIGRGDRIWTCGILLPKQALYQAEPHLVVARLFRAVRRKNWWFRTA